jgi:acyl carrier protein
MVAMSAGSVTKAEFYATLDDILDLPAGTITGGEQLKELTWDSLAIVSYIAACNGLFGIVLSGEKVKATRSIADLMGLVQQHISD